MIFTIPKTTERFIEEFPFLKPPVESNWAITKGNVEPYRKQYVIIVFGKRSLTKGVLTPDGKLRVFGILQPFLNGLLSNLDAEITIIFSGYESESIALETFFRATISEYNLDISQLKIFRENEARNTEENAKKTAILLGEQKIIPSKIFFCSTDWHVIRMWWNYFLVKEKSEICKFQEKFQNVIIEPLFAPYSYREKNQMRWMQWRAIFHVYTHFLAPLVSYLFAIGDAEDFCCVEKSGNGVKILEEEFRSSVKDLFLNVFIELLNLTQNSIKPIDKENEKILKNWVNNLEFLDNLAVNLENWTGKKVHEINLFRDTKYLKWTAYAKEVNKVINDIRFPSDPDKMSD